MRKLVKFDPKNFRDTLESEGSETLPETFFQEDVSTEFTRGSVVDHSDSGLTGATVLGDTGSVSETHHRVHNGRTDSLPVGDGFGNGRRDEADSEKNSNTRSHVNHDTPTNIFTSPQSTSHQQSLSSTSTQNVMTSSQAHEEEYYYEEDEDPDLPVEQRLMRNLLRNYERSVRPVKNATDTVIVKMGLTLTQIFDMVCTNSSFVFEQDRRHSAGKGYTLRKKRTPFLGSLAYPPRPQYFHSGASRH